MSNKVDSLIEIQKEIDERKKQEIQDKKDEKESLKGLSSIDRRDREKEKREEEKLEKEKYTSTFSAYKEEPSNYKGEKDYNLKFNNFVSYFSELYENEKSIGSENIISEMEAAFETERSEENQKIMDKKGKLSYDPEDSKNKNNSAEIAGFPCKFVDTKFVE